MGVLEWLGIRKRKSAQAQQQVEKPAEEPAKTEWQLPSATFMSDSEKLTEVLKGVYSIYDELKPRDNDGNRVSRLGLVLEGLSVKERAKVRKVLEDLDIDDVIAAKLAEAPLTIEELSAGLNKSYGYTASRLRFLKKGGKVARLRDPGTNKYKYAKLVDGASAEEIVHPNQKTLEV